MPYDLIIEPGRAERQYWRDLWHYRELFYILAWRDIAVRYKQRALRTRSAGSGKGPPDHETKESAVPGRIED